MPEVTQEIQTTDVRRRPQPEEGPLTIIYEDEWTLVVNKPAGVVVHPTYKNTSGTILNAVLWRVRDRPGAQPGILTRLDKDTSGLVVIALMPDVHATMQKDAAAGRTTKHYLAVVVGSPEPRQGQIVLPLARDRRRSPARGRDARWCSVRDALRSSFFSRRTVDRPMRARHRTHASDPCTPGRSRMADSRRSRLRSARREHHTPGAARLARLSAASDHTTAARIRSADSSGHAAPL